MMGTESATWQLARTTVLPKGSTSRRQFFFTEDLPAGARNVFRVYTPVEKLGIILDKTEPWEFQASSTFASSIVRLDDGRLRMYYTTCSQGFRRMGIAIAESGDGRNWEKRALGQEPVDGQGTNRIVFEGTVPDAQTFVGQPQVLRLRDGRWRMYFWYHGDGKIRYTVAESDDGLRWSVPDFDAPVLYHPGELGKWGHGAGLYPEPGTPPETWDSRQLAMKAMRTNDATFVYYNDYVDRYELYSVWLLPAIPDRRVDADNAPSWHRTIQRRFSDDGLAWSAPELAIWPDANDPWDQQFYHLAVQWHEDWMIGSLGHYRVEDGQQTQELELCFSRDGYRWHRPLRGGFIPRGQEAPDCRDCMGIYPPNAWIDLGDRWLCLYNGTPLRHNEATDEETRNAGAIMGATFGKNRFVGIAAGRVPGGFLTEPFFPQGEFITVDADVRGWLRYELCDTFGRKLAGYHLMQSCPVTGDDELCMLRWQDRSTAPFIHDAVRVRFEFADGVVYGIGF